MKKSKFGKLRFSLMVVMVLFSVYSCGSSTNNSSGGSNGGGVDLETSVEGKVVHSAFLASDKVCYDRNNNKQCDDGEPSALLASDGTYNIIGTLADSASVPLIAELGSSNNTHVNPSTVSALAKSGTAALVFETPSGQRVISSITTIIKSAMDNNPSLSLTEAESNVQTSLGTTENLFDSSSEVLVLANKISAAIESMFNKLAADFNITISKNTILLVMNEIIPQLSSIANGSKTPEQIANDTIGGKDKDTINQEMEDLGNNMPLVQTASDALKNGFQSYDFEKRDSPYRFKLYDMSTTAMRAFINGDYQQELPTTLSNKVDDFAGFQNNDGSVTFNIGNNQVANFMTIETIQMDSKSIKSSPLHGSKEINFTTGSIMYKFNAVNPPPVINVDELRKNNCSNTVYACGNVNINNNIIEIRWTLKDGERLEYDIVTNSDGSYFVNPKTESAKYYNNTVFSPHLVVPKGTYSKSTDSYGDFYTFKNLDGVVIFKVFRMNSQYYVAGKFNELLTNTTFLFNKTAAENIKSQWIDN